MKIFGACFVSVALTVAVLLWFLPDQGERCETIQIAYEKTIELQDQRIEQGEMTAQFLLSRIATKEDHLTKLAKAFGRVQRERDELMQQAKTINPVAAEVSKIDALAARLTPVEAKAKEEVKQSGGWINVPWLKEQLWKGAAAYGMRGK